MATRLKLLDRDTSGSKRLGILDALVTQRIELAGGHERRRQAGQIAAQR